MERKTMTAKEVAIAMGLSMPIVYELLNKKDGIPHFRIGRRILIPIDRFNTWMDEQTAIHGKP